MSDNYFAIQQIETLAHNVASYASFFNRSGDIFGEVDAAVQEAENALIELARIMRLTTD